MKEVSVKKYRINKLWSFCEQGIFAIPEIQREFVWDSKRSSSLLDSIYRRFPIGSLIIWETNFDKRHLLRHAQEILPPHKSQNRKIWFLIDGQQRLSVLYRAKHGHIVRNSNGRELDFSKLCLSFDPRIERRFIFTRRPLQKIHIPLSDILSDTWRTKLRFLSESKFSQAAKCRTLIKNYEVPVIIVHTNNLNDVRETFLRINSGGLRISEADRAFTRASRLNLRRLMTELRQGLPHGFNLIEPQILQSAMALIYGKRELGSAAVESAISEIERDEIENGKVSKAFTRKWREICKCIQKAVDYLHNELGVFNYSFLPSDNMVSLLSYFFYVNNGAQPNSKQRREIRKWFWATAVGRRYVGRGYYLNIQKDLDFFKRLGKYRYGRFTFSDLVPQDDLRRTEYLRSGGLTTAFFLMLAHRRPRYLETGNYIPLDETASLGNRKDKHHIFPRALLARNEFSAKEANSLCNICYIVAEEDQSIGSNKPIVYLSRFRNKKQFYSVMRSHLIPHRGDSGLWIKNVKRSYKVFLNQRLPLIRRELEKEAGIRLFRKD